MNLNTKITDPELSLKSAIMLWLASIVIQFTTWFSFLNFVSVIQIFHGILQMMSPFLGIYASVYMGIRLFELTKKSTLVKHSKKWWITAVVSFIFIEVFLRNSIGSLLLAV